MGMTTSASEFGDLDRDRVLVTTATRGVSSNPLTELHSYTISRVAGALSGEPRSPKSRKQ